ncbi:PREDICTED: probable tRNA N6-adenosine threonylcarbamoyltransferase, mitochondrial [Branchiostoma belcheri]|uniref:N(6)-L-threonylcarbamoyladenine synthase n=1 Tax=Branchiostoma belcheri TaxID=7741 RepID=A0A6P4YM58_BRABE|nr:PREDICTED: probable tRNA N6-adenosine threonylcarbamoyltransferase, mitochondrial [Branchiostoma belcheri]
MAAPIGEMCRKCSLQIVQKYAFKSSMSSNVLVRRLHKIPYRNFNVPRHLRKVVSVEKSQIRTFADDADSKSRLLVLGIETSCDETGAAVVDDRGSVLGEALHSQKLVHLKHGGIVPTVAQQLHRDHIEEVVQGALDMASLRLQDVTAIAATVKPGLALCLQIGVEYAKKLVKQSGKPFIPVHHMEAHALTARMMENIEFPFLVFLLSGGHCLLAVARGIGDFLLLGSTTDEAPGVVFDQVARKLKLKHHPDCSTLSGGQAIEVLAAQGDSQAFRFTVPMARYANCDFSFSGHKNQTYRLIDKMEKEEGTYSNQILSCVNNIAASFQRTATQHLMQRLHRAVLYCQQRHIIPQHSKALVLSGGVASNMYIRQSLQAVADRFGYRLVCPPPRLCTDNGVMIAWTGMEWLKEGRGIAEDPEAVEFQPRCPLGVDMSTDVLNAGIKTSPKIKIPT